MHILVTGGAGYIGSVVAADLLEKGHVVTVYDNLSRGHREAVSPGAHFVEGDIADRPKLDSLFNSSSIEAVFHFAAYAEVAESMRVPELYFRQNTASTLTLLEAMLAHKVMTLVFSSTAALYGEPSRIPIEETDPLLPTNAYGASKLLIEQMLAWFHRLHGLHYASLRYFNASGAAGDIGEAHAPESHLIPLVVEAALGEGQFISVYGTDYPTADGTCIRDYVHVRDISSAHLLALGALQQNGQLIYNLGNGHGHSVREVISAVQKVTGRSVPTRDCKRRPGDPAVLVASSKKIQRELGWKPVHSDLEVIVRDAWQWKLNRVETSSAAPGRGA